MDYQDWNEGAANFYFISRNKYFDFKDIKSHYDFYLLITKNLNVPYNKRYIVNYIFSHVFINSIAFAQKISQVKINDDEDFREKHAYDIFLLIFDEQLYKSRNFIYWHSMNKDRFPLKDIPYHDIVFEPIKIEQVCYFNHKFDSLNSNDITVVKVYLAYMQGIFCEQIEPSLWKFKYTSIFDFFDFDIKKYINKVEKKSKIISLNKQNYKDTQISNLMQIRDALFARYQALCCIEECRIEVEELLVFVDPSSLDQERYKNDMIYMMLKLRMVHILDFIENLYANENPIDVRFTFYMYKTSDHTLQFGTLMC